MGLYNDNMNFQLRHLMREQLCVHNTITCVLEKLQRGPWGQALHGFKVIPCLPNIHRAGRAKATNPIELLKGFHLKRRVKRRREPAFLPCVPVAAEVGEWQGLEDAEFPQSSGSLAQIGDERTWWHCRFLYKQEVGVAPEQTLCIIGYYP